MMDNNSTPTEREQFIIKINDIQQSMGLWYTLFARRILPFLLFFLPMNVVLEQIYIYINRYFPNNIINATFLFVTWIAAMLVFLTIAILAPKAASVVEFAVGFAYLIFAFRYHLFNNILGYSLLISMILFLLVKLVFLAFKLISMKEFSADRKNNIERDESGRVVRAVGEEVYFTKENDEDFAEAAPAADDVFFAPKEDMTEELNKVPEVDDDFYFAAKDNSADEEEAVPSADNDFFFG